MRSNVGYIESEDVVSIAYDGTIGETITIEGLKIRLPKAPPKTKIWKLSARKEEQFFKRQDLPRGLRADTEDDFQEYTAEQYRIKREGFWFMNNGKPEYITGAHWFLLQWCRSQAERTEIYPLGEYFFFTKAQQKLYYMMEAAWVDNRSFGTIFIKPRRIGGTAIANAFSLCKSITKMNGLFGLTSKTDKDAKSAFKRFGYMFDGLPSFFMPANKGVTISEIEYNPPRARNTSKTKQAKVDGGLNTFVNYKATTEASYDGEALTFYIMDEASKYPSNVSVIAHWEIVQKALTKGMKKTGKVFIVSTVENYNAVKDVFKDKNAAAGDRFMHMYENSDPKHRLETGETETGLYKIFISCYEHYESMIDKYGYVIMNDSKDGVKNAEGNLVKKGMRTIMKEMVQSLEKRPHILYGRLRKTPRSIDDVKRVLDADGVFNSDKILAQIEHNNNSETKTITGNFVWIEEYSKAAFSPCSNGRFSASFIPDMESNNVTRGIGGLMYPNNMELCIGVDPYRYEDTVSGGSAGSIHGYSVTNSIGAPNNGFFLEYIDRPKTKEIFFQDVIKACFFYGCPAMIERDVPELLTTMYSLGLTNFCKRNSFKAKKDLTKDERKYGGVSLRGGISTTHTSAIETFIDEHVGYADNDKWREEGTIGEMPFNRTLQDWLLFDPTKRTKFDASISSGLAIIGLKKKNTRAQIENKRSLKGVINFYGNYGSKPLG